MGKILYFDCFSGISGDMTIGALLDLGIDQKEFRQKLGRLNMDGYRLEIKKKLAKGISATDFDVILETKHTEHGHHHDHRNLENIEKIIDSSDLDEAVKTMGKKIFNKIAVSEAKIHGKSIDEIHFHEVGAIDSIVDIVGAAICISMLKPDRILSSPLHLGTGTVKCAHGIIPVPAPATVDILKETPVYSTGVKGELVTPTGAAIITSLADDFIPLPPMTIEKIGYGTGKREYEIINALRVFSGTEATSEHKGSKKLMMLETNIDDMNPEIYSYLVPLLLDKGALDVFLTNIIMKKGRPGVMLSVLCKPESYFEFEQIIYEETTTLGIRKQMVDRDCLERKTVTLSTQFGELEAKAAFKDGKLLKISPEYEDCKRIAEKNGLAIKDVYNILVKEILDFRS